MSTQEVQSARGRACSDRKALPLTSGAWFSACLFAQSAVLAIQSTESSLGGCGIDHRGYHRNSIRGKSSKDCVFFYDGFVLRAVDAINSVAGDEALVPLDIESQFAQDTARSLRNGFQFGRRESTCTGNIAFDDIFGHLLHCSFSFGAGQDGVIAANCSSEDRGELPPLLNLGAGPHYSWAQLT
jgi:hypothetical protein